MEGAFEIRPATADDAEALDRVICAAWLWAYRDVVPEEILDRYAEPGRRVDRLRDSFLVPRRAFAAVDAQGVVIGLALGSDPPGLQGFDSEIGGFYVHPDHARTGVGRALLHAFREDCLLEGKRTLCIHTLKENKIGRAFYEKMGGRLIAEASWQGLPSLWYGWD